MVKRRNFRKIIAKRPERMSTHLFLNSRQMVEFILNDHSGLEKVEVLYAHDNLLTNIDKLSFLTSLTHVYLQWNEINCTKNLRNLPCLRKLYLGFNCISTVEGLDGMPNLELLHVQRQKLASSGGALNFCPTALQNISKSLKELNIAGNHLSSISSLKCLHELTHLDASNNMISDKKEVCSVLAQWKNLQYLDVRENPLLWTNGRFQFKIISLCENLEVLNAKHVLQSTRSFLYNLGRVQGREGHHSESAKLRKRAQFCAETQSLANQMPMEMEIAEIFSRSLTLSERVK